MIRKLINYYLQVYEKWFGGKSHLDNDLAIRQFPLALKSFSDINDSAV